MPGSDVSSLPVTTVAERKAAEASRRKRAADRAVRELRRYAREHGGRFIVFGSYITDTMRFDSDLDVLVDFPLDGTGDAWRFVEDVCGPTRPPRGRP